MSLVFLDRDGVINRFPGVGLYVTREEDFEFLPGSLEALALLKKAGHEVHVVSNQGCVSRGLISAETLQRMTQRMLEKVREHGGRIDGVLYCTHQKTDRCDCKKPATRLFLKAIGSREPDMRKEVFFVGDSEEDLEAAHRLGCRSVLVLSGRLREEDLETLLFRPDVVKQDLHEAVRWILDPR